MLWRISYNNGKGHPKHKHCPVRIYLFLLDLPCQLFNLKRRAILKTLHPQDFQQKRKRILPFCRHKNQTDWQAPCRVSPMLWTCHKLTWSKVGMQTCRFILGVKTKSAMVNQGRKKGHAESTYWQCSSISFKHFT